MPDRVLQRLIGQYRLSRQRRYQLTVPAPPNLPVSSRMPTREVQTAMILKFQAALNGDWPLFSLTWGSVSSQGDP